MFKSKVLQLWHPESPGVRVYVRRRWWQRVFLKERFAYLGEKTLQPYQMVDVKIEAIQMAAVMHQALALHGRTTEFDPESYEGRQMTAACLYWLTGGHLLTAE